MSKISIKKISVKIFAGSSLLAFILFIIMSLVLILNAAGVQIYSHKLTIWTDESRPDESYWGWSSFTQRWEDNSTKTLVFTLFGLSCAWTFIPWLIAVAICLLIKGGDVFTPKQQKMIYYAFPISFFWLVKIRKIKKGADKPKFDFFEDPFRKLKDELIYGLISPEDFEKKYSELQSKPKISD